MDKPVVNKSINNKSTKDKSINNKSSYINKINYISIFSFREYLETIKYLNGK
jgi:hypothetical protein